MIRQKKQKMSERIKALKSGYPAAVIFALKNLGRDDEVEKYMKHCESLDRYTSTHRSWPYYSQYVHGFLLPKLEEHRKNGYIKSGKLL